MFLAPVLTPLLFLGAARLWTVALRLTSAAAGFLPAKLVLTLPSVILNYHCSINQFKKKDKDINSHLSVPG